MNNQQRQTIFKLIDDWTCHELIEYKINVSVIKPEVLDMCIGIYNKYNSTNYHNKPHNYYVIKKMFELHFPEYLI